MEAIQQSLATESSGARQLERRHQRDPMTPLIAALVYILREVAPTLGS
jgi:hypothetical protein